VLRQQFCACSGWGGLTGPGAAGKVDYQHWPSTHGRGWRHRGRRARERARALRPLERGPSGRPSVCVVSAFDLWEPLRSSSRELFVSARPGDLCIINADDYRVAALPVPDGARTLSFGAHPAANSMRRRASCRLAPAVRQTFRPILIVTIRLMIVKGMVVSLLLCGPGWQGPPPLAMCGWIKSAPQGTAVCTLLSAFIDQLQPSV
jgi:hypothetical protein